MRILLALALLAYPAAVYLLMDSASPVLLAGVFAVLAACRLLLAKHLSKTGIVFGLLAVAVLYLLTQRLGDLSVLKLYPVALSLCGAAWCAYTLWTPPNAIARLLILLNASAAGLPRAMRERIPMAAEGLDLSTVQMRYLQRLTAVWLGFFLLNALLAGVTLTAEDTGWWALYNGLISYALAGLLLFGETLYRGVYQRRHEPEHQLYYLQQESQQEQQQNSPQDLPPDTSVAPVAGSSATEQLTPNWETTRHSDERFSARGQIPEDLPCFAGHFPGQPLLPGVMQLAWAVELAASAWPGQYTADNFRGTARIKFKAPVLPGAQVTIELQTQDQSRQIARPTVSLTIKNGKQTCTSAQLLYHLPA